MFISHIHLTLRIGNIGSILQQVVRLLCTDKITNSN